MQLPFVAILQKFGTNGVTQLGILLDVTEVVMLPLEDVYAVVTVQVLADGQSLRATVDVAIQLPAAVLL